MISIERLREHLAGDWVAFDKHGETVDYVVPKDIGPATISVSPVTDAIKRVDDGHRVAESIDKNSVWAVDAIVLNSIVLARLPDDAYTAHDLIEAVREVGFAWQISPTSVL